MKYNKFNWNTWVHQHHQWKRKAKRMAAPTDVNNRVEHYYKTSEIFTNPLLTMYYNDKYSVLCSWVRLRSSETDSIR